jgi:hypothetical protein
MRYKFLKSGIGFLLAAFAFMNANGQTVQVTPKITVNQNTVYFEVYVQSESEQNVLLGNSVFEVTYNKEKLSYLGKELDMDGLWDDGNSTDYHDTFSTNIGNRAIFRVLYKVGDGLIVPTAEAARVGCLIFQLNGEFSPDDISWSAPFCILSDIHEQKLNVDLKM